MNADSLRILFDGPIAHIVYVCPGDCGITIDGWSRTDVAFDIPCRKCGQKMVVADKVQR